MSDIKFSIGIPAFKDQFFKKCIESILNQTYSNFELIIVNDCSPKDLSSIVKQFNDERIKYFENEKNTGAVQVVNNWNKCLERATGDFFVLMGDDDMMAPNYLEEFEKLINKYPDLDVFHCRTIIIDENDKPKILTTSWPEFETVYENIWHRLTGKRKQYISDFVYRTQHLNENNGFFYLPLAWGSDDITTFRACGEKGIAHTNKPVFKYRSNNYSITSTGNSTVKMQATVSYFDWLYNFLNQSEPQNYLEKITHIHLQKGFERYFEIKKINILISSISSGLIKNTFSWIKQKKRFDLTFTQILQSFAIAFKKKLKN